MEQQTVTPPPSTAQPPEVPQQPPPPPEPSPPTPTTTTTTTASSATLPPPTTTTTTATTSSLLSSTTTSAPPLPTLPSPSQNPQSPTPSPTPAPTSTSTSTSTPTSQARPIAAFNRPWQQPPQPTPFSHFSLPPPPLPLPPHSSSSSSTNTSASTSSSPSLPRGGMAIGVPAHHPGNPSLSSISPPSYGQPFGGLGRNVADSPPTSSSSSQVRPNVGGIQGIGMMGKLGTSSAMRPPGVPVKPVQSSPRPQSSPNIQSSATQNFQGHGMLRISSAGSPGSPSPGSSHGQQLQNQPWLNSGSQMKPPLQSSRPQVSPQSMQQRSHIPQQHHHTTTTISQQQASSAQPSQLPSTSGAGPLEHYGQQFPQSRIQQSLPNQQQIARNPSVGTQRPSHSTISSNSIQPALPNRAPSAEPEEPCNRILSKRSIQELVTQVDPSEKLDPEVEDILVDIAEDFVESITTFGCSLAKHRKSTTLEAKDILLHLERNWNMNLPGFSGDEIKMYRKPFISDIHRERLAVVKKSILAGETINSRTSAGQAGGHPRGHLAKGPASIVGSPPTKVREAA